MYSKGYSALLLGYMPEDYEELQITAAAMRCTEGRACDYIN